jgi:hypothetical protein
MPDPPTVPSIKQSFLSAQIRLLSQPLQPSRAFLTANANADRGAGIPKPKLHDALARLNALLAQHVRRAYPPQATRHVAEQIDALYLAAGAPRPDETEGAGGGGAGAAGGEEADPLRTAADLADPPTAAALPEAWPDAREAERRPPEAARYAELSERARDAAAAVAAARARVAALRAADAALAPFAGGGDAVQPNLVTRGGEVERELERMRVLLARVGDRVARLREEEEEEEEEEGKGDESSDSLFRGGDEMVVDDGGSEERRRVGELLKRF